MATKAMPPIPPRPARAQGKHISTAPGGGGVLSGEVPRIPPRPINRRIERSQSPHRDSFAPSPLNEPSFLANYGTLAKDSLYGSGGADTLTTDLSRRSSSVALPSLGQEGTEYAEIFGESDDAADPATQTRSVANDLHLHAPKPSLPVSSAKQRVSTVTRTDSSQAAALGIGKANSDDADPHARSLKARASFASQTSNGTERPPSCSESEHGIPEIGQRVPMYPNAGDVQAPSPAPFATPYTPGIGFHNDGSKPRHHSRRTSARGFEGPPGSYGLHGHGIIPNDRFEKAYYEKHPELLKQESGQYSGALADGRGEWALSSDDLNKIVRETASRGSGLGTSANVMSTPSEQIGFLATEEYATRLSSSRPQSAGYHKNQPQTYADSPLRKQSIPGDTGKLDLPSALSQSARSDHHESEVEDDDVVHIDPPERRASVVYESGGYMESTESLGGAGTPGGDEDITDERGYSAPILAADEVAKDPFGYELQPAVSPNQERGSTEPATLYRTTSASSSRPTSRPVSIHGGIAGVRFYQADFDRDTHHTPLEDLEEYEPLFPDDEKSGALRNQQKPLTVADKLKRPDTKNRKFPSQDIWEDTPNSLYYTTTVSTPQLPEEAEQSKKMKGVQIHEGETPEQAFARRQEELAEQEAADADSFLNREKKPWAHNSDIDTRPGARQRFPSRDIWESSPDSLQLTTTVSQPQADEKESAHLPEDGPTTDAVDYHQEKAAGGLEPGHEEGPATTGAAILPKPQVPARPTKQKPAAISSNSATSSPTDKAPPPIPAKSKPQIPARPIRSTSKDADTLPLTKVTLASSSKSMESDQGSQATVPLKAKPPVPARPMGSKIAALQSGFMSDLDERLRRGPQPPKKDEPAAEEVVEEKERAPLTDVRKGRAPGPMRRAPAKSPAPATELASVPATTGTLAFSKLATLWEIHPVHGSLKVNSYEDISDSHATDKTPLAQAPALATNIHGQSLKELDETAYVSEKPAAQRTAGGAASHEPSIEELHAKETEEQRKQMTTAADDQSISLLKMTDDPLAASVHQEKENDSLSESTMLKEVPGSTKRQDIADSTTEQERASATEEHTSITTGVKEKLETLIGGKGVITGTEDTDHSASSRTEEEQMRGSVERESDDMEK